MAQSWQTSTTVQPHFGDNIDTGYLGNLINLQGQINPNQTSGGFSGVDYNYFTNLLQNQISKGDPNMPLYQQNATAGINRQSNQSTTKLKQNLAQNGMLGSGATTAGLLGIQGNAANAQAQSNLGLAQMDTSYRSNALSNLLGLQQMGLSEQQGNRAWLGNLLGMQQGQMNSDMSANLSQQQINNQPSGWGQLVGQGLGAGAQIGSAAILASDKRVKNNIKHVGTSKMGLPIVEFNYINSPKRFRGTIAQEVEKIKPEAVSELNGIKMVDYSQVDVRMEEIFGE